ncbi:MAG: C13 family peptidase [Chloroflexota bacterium]
MYLLTPFYRLLHFSVMLMFVALLFFFPRKAQAHPDYALLASPSIQETHSALVPLSDIAQLVGGWEHTCALTNSGSVLCWGRNNDGQLGDGSTTDKSTPVAIRELSSGVSSISTGAFHTCALTSSGGVLCWGRNSDGQLGDGSTTDKSTPVAVNGLSSGVTAISAGSFHTCALTNSSVQCWGSNGSGQLGNGSTTSSSTPVLSNPTSAVIAVTTGDEHSCVRVVRGGAVYCWGDNGSGQLGNGSTTSSDTPVSVIGFPNDITAISAGGDHSCAITDNDDVVCWGSNDFGQLGNGSTIASSIPLAVNNLSGSISAIRAGSFHTCALTSNESVQCWGRNDFGQLGNGSNARSTTPVDVRDLSGGVIAITSGSFHACALSTTGGTQCWGRNGFGQLGDGITVDSRTPVVVSGLSGDVNNISAGDVHSCALTTGGGALCWGDNSSGQLGDGTTADSSTPVAVSGLSSGITAISAGPSYTCALTSSGSVQCWGYNGSVRGNDSPPTRSLTPVEISGLSNGTISIAVGSRHTCVLGSSGGVQCWGENSFGQLGNGSVSFDVYRSTPVPVNGLSSGVTAISAGPSYTCALTSNGGVQCWGDNRFGQLGDGSTTSSSTPVAVNELSSGVIAISVGEDHSCALDINGGVFCWGDNDSGELGNGSYIDSTTPVAVNGLSSGVAVISAGGHHTCALTNSGVLCWGDSRSGELGSGSSSTGNSSSTPVLISELSSGITSISSGSSHACALTNLGDVRCWGDNVHGQLGDGRLFQSLVPTDVMTTATCHTLSFDGTDLTTSPTNSIGCLMGQYITGESIILSATLPSGYQVDSWSGTSNDDSSATTNSLTMPGGDHIVGVTYALIEDDYEPDNTCANAKSVSADGSPQPHTFHQNGDVDWLKLATDLNASYQIEVDVPTGSPADVTLELYADCESLPSEIWDERFTPGARIELNDVAFEQVYLRLTNADDSVSGVNVTYQVFITKKEEPQGALILVAGRLRGGDRLQENIHNVTNYVYELFLGKGLTDDDITYLATSSALPGYDGPATTERLKSAITEWAPQQVNSDGVLTLYLMDHGGRDLFYLDDLNDEHLTPTMLDEWLTTFEGLVPNAKVNVVIEACNSGSFIAEPGSVSKQGRVIVTSTNVENDAYASQYGAYFSDHFLVRLQRNFNLFYSFRRSREMVSDLNSLQRPWLDADGNGVPNESEDELIASQRGFACAGTFADVWPPYIFTAQKPTTIIDGRGAIQVEVRDNEGVDSVWAVIYPPSYVPPPNGNQLVAETLDTVLLQPQGNDQYSGSYPGFTESGPYRVVIHAKDEDDLQAEPVVLEVETRRSIFLPWVVQ